MRILLVGDYPADPRLGSSRVYYELRHALERLGHECDVVLQPDIGAWGRAHRLRSAVAPVLAARAVRRRRAPGSAWDVIDVASAEGVWLAAARRLGGRAAVVSRSHGLEHLNYRRMLDDAAHGVAPKPLHTRVWHPVTRLTQVAAAARLADRMVVTTTRERDFVVQRGWKAAARVDVVPHGVVDATTPAAASRPRGDGLLFCGTWNAVKGTSYLAAAFAQVVARRPGARLTVLGPGVPAARVLADFPEAARPRVTVRDRTDAAGVRAAYASHDALVMSSTYEGFGMVVGEAMGCGLPVIATAVGCAPDLVTDGVTGLLVPPRSADALARAALTMLDDAALRARLAAAARERVEGMTWDATARATVAAYERAIAGGPA